MRALVTGGAGFIGSSVARALLEAGHEVRVLDNFLTGHRDAVPDGTQLIEGDLRAPEDLARACEGIEVVFHQGALRSVPRSVDEPQLVEACNVAGTLNLLMAAERAGVRRLVYASSSSVYGDRDELEHEGLAPDPLSPYAVSKLAGEHYCRAWTKLGRLPTVSLRYFNVFGPGQHRESKYAAVFPAFIGALAAGEPPELHWDGEQSRDFTYIDDVVASNVAAASAPAAADGEVFNIGGGKPRTVNEVLGAVSDAIGTWIEPAHMPRRAGDVRHTRADISRAREVLGWEPKADWADAVAATVGWFTSR